MARRAWAFLPPASEPRRYFHGPVQRILVVAVRYGATTPGTDWGIEDTGHGVALGVSNWNGSVRCFTMRS